MNNVIINRATDEPRDGDGSPVVLQQLEVLGLINTVTEDADPWDIFAVIDFPRCSRFLFTGYNDFCRRLCIDRVTPHLRTALAHAARLDIVHDYDDHTRNEIISLKITPSVAQSTCFDLRFQPPLRDTLRVWSTGAIGRLLASIPSHLVLKFPITSSAAMIEVIQWLPKLQSLEVPATGGHMDLQLSMLLRAMMAPPGPDDHGRWLCSKLKTFHISGGRSILSLPLTLFIRSRTNVGIETGRPPLPGAQLPGALERVVLIGSLRERASMEEGLEVLRLAFDRVVDVEWRDLSLSRPK
ncbi:hypothetical protein FRB95_004019 [Tulasnella sp. JGI-2019a]|nr:hypothetical protein FRB95_004019 [Tulasnella sp. JGI-2019a]